MNFPKLVCVLLVVLLEAVWKIETTSHHVLVCYFPKTAKYRQEPYKYTATLVPGDYCTHVIYGFLTIHNKCPMPATADEKEDLAGLVKLKEKHPGIKVLVGVGGENVEQWDFREIAKSPATMKTFAHDLKEYLDVNKLDGMDLFWPNPEPEDKDLLVRLLQELDTELTNQYIISASLSASEKVMKGSYDVPEMMKVLDMVNIMGFDFHGHWDLQIGLHSALYPLSEHWPYYSVNWVVEKYLQLGLDTSKAVLGVPMYGRVFRLCDEDKSVVESKGCGAGKRGPVSETEGVLYYYEICDMLKKSGWKTVYDVKSRVPYSFKGDQWITYDNKTSVAEKMAYVKANSMLGGMVWDISQDDFMGQCGAHKYPLVRQMALSLGIVGVAGPAMHFPAETEDKTKQNSMKMARRGPMKDETSVHVNHDMILVCYFPEWSRYRQEPYKFVVEDVPTDYCTHIIFSFLTIHDNLPASPSDAESDMLNRLVGLKKKQAGLKILAAMGGAGAQDWVFTNIVKTPESIAKFAEATLKYIEDTGIDGIDVDWEFPSVEQRGPYIDLLNGLRKAFGDKYLLTAAVGAGQQTIEQVYDVPAMSKVLDIVNIMTYDLHGHWDAQIGLHAGLYPQTVHWPYYSVDWVISRYLELGLDPRKATLGVALYGRVFRLCDPTMMVVESKGCGAGAKGPVSDTMGVLFYYEICTKLKEGGWTTVMDEKSRVPYSYLADQWITYDNKASVEEKMRYINEKGLMGGMVWDVSQDDFSNMCKQGEFPLLREMAHGLGLLESGSVGTTKTPETGQESGSESGKMPGLESEGNSTNNQISNKKKQDSNRVPVNVCYYTNWSRYRPAPYTFTPKNIVGTHCSHIIWAYVTLKNNSAVPATKDESEELAALSERTRLKVLASLGGPDAIAQYREIIKSQDSIDSFAQSVLTYVETNKLAGVDMAWVFPEEKEKNQYIQLLRALRGKFRLKYMLTAPVVAKKEIIETAYNVTEMNKFVDLVHIMAYHLHGPWEEHTGLQAALYPENEHWPNFSVDWVVSRYLELGLNPAIATLGISLSGSVFKLCNAGSFETGAVACGEGKEGNASRTPGVLYYYEVCQRVNVSDGWTIVFDNKSLVPYCYKGDQWITHENKESISNKVKYIQEKGLAGAMVWEISQDDFADMCGDGNFPLVSLLAEMLDINRPVSSALTTTCNATLLLVTMLLTYMVTRK